MSSHSSNQRDPADIGPQDLWIVWFHGLADLRDRAGAPIQTKWMLAEPGEEGVRALASDNGFGKGFLAALPLSVLRALALVLPEQGDTSMPKWVRVALGGEDELIFVQGVDGTSRVVSRASEIQAGDKELLRGSRSDFDEILRDGNRIFDEKDWSQVFGDMRAFVKHGEVGWLGRHVNPEGARIFEELIAIGRDEH